MSDVSDVYPDLSVENGIVRDMVEWFLARYEDPVESCPRDDGEFVFIWGGPYVAEDLIGTEKFVHEDQANIDRAVHLLNEISSEWAEKPPRTTLGVAELLAVSVDTVLFAAEGMGIASSLEEEGWSNADIEKVEYLLDNGTGVRLKTRRLIRRGDVTIEELNKLSCNSSEREALVPKMNDEAFLGTARGVLKNCASKEQPFIVPEESVVGLYAPELIRRLQGALGYAETIDCVREALGQEVTHYHVIAGDVKELVEAVEKHGGPAAEVLQKLRERGRR